MDNKFSNIKERILYLVEYHKDIKDDFFKEIGMTYGNFKGENKKTPINSNALVNILSKYADISERWLLTGEGEMLKEDRENHFREATKMIPATGVNGIPLIPINAMAGFGSGECQVLEYECDRYVVPLFKEAEFLITVKGSSMIPKYNSGDIVACKKLALDDLFFQWNKVYVLDTAQGALIKRVQEDKDHEGSVLIVSDNPAYPPFSLCANQIHSIAIVVGVIRLE